MHWYKDNNLHANHYVKSCLVLNPLFYSIISFLVMIVKIEKKILKNQLVGHCYIFTLWSSLYRFSQSGNLNRHMRTHKEQNGGVNPGGAYVAAAKDLSRSTSPYLPDHTRLRDWTKEAPKIYWEIHTDKHAFMYTSFTYE